MKPTRLLWIFLIALAAVRLVLIGQMELMPDEAYYHLWSQKLDWWYFSKGPGVALAMRLGTTLFGHGEFGVRFLSPLLSFGTSLILFALGRRLYGEKVAFWTVVLINLTPIFNVGSLLLTIDPLSIFFWTAALYTIWRALENSPEFSLWWPLTGLLIGFGWLAKMTNAAMLASIVLLLLLTPRYRGEFFRAGFWSMLLAFAPFVAEFVWWQQSHAWPTTAHLVARGGMDTPWWAFDLGSFGEWAGSHFGTYSPLIFGGMIFALWVTSRDSVYRWGRALLKSISVLPRSLGSHRLFVLLSVLLLVAMGFLGNTLELPWLTKLAKLAAALCAIVFVHANKEVANMHWKARFLLAFTLPLFVGYAWVALHHESEPNWTAPATVSLALLAVAFWCEEREGRTWVPRAAGIALGLSALLTILVLDTDLPRRCGVAWPYEKDPSTRMRGWHEAARLVGDFRKAYEQDAKTPVFLIADDYGTAAILCQYLPEPRSEVPGHPAVYIPESPVASSQFHFWGRYDEFELRTTPITDDMSESSEEGTCLFAGRTALYITDRGEENPPRIFKQTFEKCELIAVFDQTRRGLPLRQLRIFSCKNYKPMGL